MPAISDPGQDLVDRCLRAGLPVVSVPGPTAFATAVALSGMDSTRFTFVGFLAVEKKKRREQLDFIKKQTLSSMRHPTNSLQHCRTSMRPSVTGR